MDRKKFIDLLFEKGKKAGFEEMEAFIQSNSELEIMVFKGETDKYSRSEEEGLSFRGLYNGKMGYSYTEKIDEAAIEYLIQEAMENAKIIDSDDEELIFEGSKEYKEVYSYNEQLEEVSAEEKINFAKKMEEEALSLDDRVDAVNYCLYNDNTLSTVIVNTKGLNLEQKANRVQAYVSAVVKDGDDVKTGAKYRVTNDFSKLDPKSIAKEAIDEGVSMLGATSIESSDYPVILRNDVSASILQAFAVIFSAEEVQKDFSLLKGKIGETIASPLLTIVDDPFMEDGVHTRSFDAEGVASKYKKVVDKGVLKTYLHNTKTAKKDGVESTGNASKQSYKSPLVIAPTNMYIENGDTSFDEMVSSIDKGLIIIDVQGLHAGLNKISGDFSLSAYGYEVVNGKIERPVNQITIAANYYDMLKNIEAVGDDLEFAIPSYGFIGSPSIKVKSLSVAGK